MIKTFMEIELDIENEKSLSNLWSTRIADTVLQFYSKKGNILRVI